MSLRFTLAVSIAALSLTGCNVSRTPQGQADCRASCPPQAAPAPKPEHRADAGETTGKVRKAKVRHRRYAPAVREGYSRVSYEREVVSGYGGRYGTRGATLAGGVVSVQESTSASQRYSYSETSSAYGSAYGSSGGYAYGYAAGGYQGGYAGYAGGPPAAGVDRNGYLTWPGKVER